MCRYWLAAVVGLVTWLSAGVPAWGLTAVPPVPGPVVRGFDPPAQPWLAGHRGVDVLGSPGEPVVAAAAGVVRFAGNLAGRGVVVVDHGDVRTTYLPLTPTVAVGTRVSAGQTIGRLTSGHRCPGGSCLHWGLKRGDAYLDPLSLLDPVTLRLLPGEAPAQASALAKARQVAFDSGRRAPGTLLTPVPGRITSPFGLRFHPIFHEWRMHNGVDLSASCGTPIRAAADGVVASVSYDSSGGHRLVSDHGVIGGRRLSTAYLHAQGYRVRRGARVLRGDVVGTVGSTGWSTGCHLHLSVTLDGRQVDPQRLL